MKNIRVVGARCYYEHYHSEIYAQHQQRRVLKVHDVKGAKEAVTLVEAYNPLRKKDAMKSPAIYAGLLKNIFSVSFIDRHLDCRPAS